MPNYAPNYQPPNYANNYAGIIRRCLVLALGPINGHYDYEATVSTTTAGKARCRPAWWGLHTGMRPWLLCSRQDHRKQCLIGTVVLMAFHTGCVWMGRVHMLALR